MYFSEMLNTALYISQEQIPNHSPVFTIGTTQIDAMVIPDSWQD